MTAEKLFKRGVKNQEAGQLEEALADYTMAIGLDPLLSEVYNNRGYIYFLRQEYKSALTDLTQAIKLNPTDGKALANRGAVFGSLQRHQEALADFNRAIQLNPQLAQAYSDRGGVYFKMRRDQEAIADFNRAIQLDPTLAVAFFNMGVLLARRGMMYDALPYFNRANQLGFAQAKPAALRVRQELFVAANEDGSIEQATEAVLDATSDDELRKAVARYPYMTLPEFIASLEEGLKETLPPDLYHIAKKQQLKLLRKLAEEQA